MNARLCLRLASLVCLFAPAAFAGPTPSPTIPVVPVKVNPVPLNLAPPKWTITNASENDMKDAMDVAASAPIGSVSALAGFRFRFQNGDHKLRKMGVLGKDRYASFTYADQNGDDPFQAEATWAVVGAGRGGSVTATGGGQFEVPIPGGKLAGHTLVLTGFEFRRQDGTDANVRSIGVWLDSDRSTARVMLMDDQGADFRGFERTIGAALLAGAIPMGEMKGTVDTMLSAIGRVNRGQANGKYRPFAITVQYAWIPNSGVAGTEAFTGTGRNPSSGKVFPATGVLQGFEFYFTNSDHNILDMGIMGPLLKPPASLPSPNGEVVEYQDNNRDDPMRWGAQFVTLRPSAN